MKLLFKVLIILLLFTSISKAEKPTDWLNNEIDIILDAYKQTSLSSVEKFKLIENTVNNNFAGAGIAKFVAGKSWSSAPKEIKKEYIKLFKKHLALNIASLMRSYSNQEYKLINSKYDEKNKVTLIDMKIINDTRNLLVTWRVKESKDRFFIIDLIIADISLVLTKRSEFNSMLKKVDYNLKKLNDVLANQNNLSYKIITK